MCVRSLVQAAAKKLTGYDTLVLSGGGVRGIAMLGAVQYLVEHDELRGVNRFIGTSVGSIVAAVLATRQSPQTVFWEHVFRYEWKHRIDLSLLDRGFGLDSGRSLMDWLHRMFDDSLTFEEIRRRYGTTLVVCVTNLNKRHAEYFGPDTTPDFPVIKALRMSCSVPMYFSAVRMGGSLYVDGGICDNFPIERAFELGAKRVLGIRFVSKTQPPGTAWTLDGFLGAILESSLVRRIPERATVMSLECGASVQTLNFKLPDAQRQILYTDGYKQAYAFMKKQV